MPHRYISCWTDTFPKIGIDLGYSARQPSCGLAFENGPEAVALKFGDCLNAVTEQISKHGPHHLIVEAVLSTYHRPDGNPDLRGTFEKGRGWYHGPGVSTYAAALRFLAVLDEQLPAAVQLPLTEGFLSYKPARTTHIEDAQRLIKEYGNAECFSPREGSTPICAAIHTPPEIRRYNSPPTSATKR
jgi:hypothetical protein